MKALLTRRRTLLEALRDLAPGASNRTLRQMLRQARVRVNGTTWATANRLLHAGDIVEVGPRARSHRKVGGIDLLFEDEYLLVAQKPHGLLTVSTLREKEHTAQAYLRAYVKAKDPRGQIFVVHRLDRHASGLLVFARSEKVKERLRDLFSRHEVRRKYWAVVQGRVEPDQDTIRSYLAEDRSLRMRSTEDPARGKLSVTHFRVLRRFSNLSALEVTLETGRKNQIRAHLSEMGHPIAGDKAYGSAIDPMRRLGLHAFLLAFRHPVRGTVMTFRTAPPPEFLCYL